MTRPLRWIAIVLMLVSVPVLSAEPDMRRPKKLLATGWDHVDTQRLEENQAAIEARPFDAVVVDVMGTDAAGKRVPLKWALREGNWERAWFAPAVEQIRKVRFKRPIDVFILFGANPGSVDWFDDAGWKQIVEHFRIAAWAARQSGAKGILFDPEPYAAPHAAFRYAAQAEHEKHSFAEYYAKARARGRAVMEAVAAEYPDMTLFTYFMNSVCAAAVGQADPRGVLRAHGYGLYPAFIDGWLDVVPPQMTLVDGCESAYLYNSQQQFLEAAALMRGDCQDLISPANRAKYRAQVQTSFGIYLDAYWNPPEPKTHWFVDGLGGPRVDRLRANVRTALRLADEYVWIYGEKHRWWPTPNKGVRAESWPEALPGSEDALRFARDPVEFVRKQLGRETTVNLLRNGSFSEAKLTEDGKTLTWQPGRPPLAWNAWQHERSKGRFDWDREAGAQGKGSAKASGIVDGCFLQKVAVTPGQAYVVRGVRRVAGGGEGWIRARWQDQRNQWVAETSDRLFYTSGPSGEWSEMIGVVDVPEGAAYLVVLLGAAGDRPESAAWFDDVVVQLVRR